VQPQQDRTMQVVYGNRNGQPAPSSIPHFAVPSCDELLDIPSPPAGDGCRDYNPKGR